MFKMTLFHQISMLGDLQGRVGAVWRQKSPNSEPTSGVTHFGDFAFAIFSLRYMSTIFQKYSKINQKINVKT